MEGAPILLVEWRPGRAAPRPWRSWKQVGQDLAWILRVAYNDGYALHEVNAILNIVMRDREQLLRAWHEHIGDRREDAANIGRYVHGERPRRLLRDGRDRHAALVVSPAQERKAGAASSLGAGGSWSRQTRPTWIGSDTRRKLPAPKLEGQRALLTRLRSRCSPGVYGAAPTFADIDECIPSLLKVRTSGYPANWSKYKRTADSLATEGRAWRSRLRPTRSRS